MKNLSPHYHETKAHNNLLKKKSLSHFMRIEKRINIYMLELFREKKLLNQGGL